MRNSRARSARSAVPERRTSRLSSDISRSARASRVSSAGRRAPAGQHLQPGQELGQGEGLDQIVVGAGLQALHPLVHLAERAEHQDQRLVARGAQGPAGWSGRPHCGSMRSEMMTS